MSDPITIGFNEYATPKIETKRFKLYANVGTTAEPVWELQGRGISSWTVEQNGGVEKVRDVLGFVDMERTTPQPTQTGVEIKLREESQLGVMLFKAWALNDMSAINSVEIIQKFEFVDGNTNMNAFARKDKGVMIDITSFTGEAGGYLGFVVDFHYSNDFVFGQVSKEDGTTITFTQVDVS